MLSELIVGYIGSNKRVLGMINRTPSGAYTNVTVDLIHEARESGYHPVVVQPACWLDGVPAPRSKQDS